MEPSALLGVPPESHVEASPLGAARIRRRMTVEQAAARAALDVEDIKCLEESRIYRFPSVEDAIAATLVYATALGIDQREARELAGLAVRPRRRWSFRRWLAAVCFVAALAALAWFVVLPEIWDRGAAPPAAPHAEAPKLRPPWEIRVDVYNGTQVPNAATMFANEIGGPLAYRIGTVENADRLDYTETRVYYPPGSEDIAGRLARQLGVETAALPGGREPNRLVVIVGADRAQSP